MMFNTSLAGIIDRVVSEVRMECKYNDYGDNRIQKHTFC